MKRTNTKEAFTAIADTVGFYKSARVVSAEDILQHARNILAARCQRGETLTCVDDVRNFVMLELSGLEQEVFAALYLDNRHRILTSLEIMFRGTLNGTAVYPREIVKRALALNAGAIVVVHNHPSGIAEPSCQDETLTERLKTALELVDIRLLDHIVVGAGETVSFSERGLL